MKHLRPSSSSKTPIASTTSRSVSIRPQHGHGRNLFEEEGDTCTVLSFRRPGSTPKVLRFICRTNRPACQSYPIRIVQLLRHEQTTYYSKDVQSIPGKYTGGPESEGMDPRGSRPNDQDRLFLPRQASEREGPVQRRSHRDDRQGAGSRSFRRPGPD